MALDTTANSTKKVLWQTWDQKAQKEGRRGTVYETNGNIYTGDWKNNKKDGFGHQKWNNGNEYEGEWSNGYRHGTGTIWLALPGGLHKLYSGQWANDKYHGQGDYYYQNGNVYCGQWETGMKHGAGVMHYKKTGNTYSGEWVYDKCEGQGVMTYQSDPSTEDFGNFYIGCWRKGKREGEGTYFYADSLKRYDGLWVDGIAKCGQLVSIPEENYLKKLQEVKEIISQLSYGLNRDRENEENDELLNHKISPPPSKNYSLPVCGLVNPEGILQEQMALYKQEQEQ